ncbi:hypothetical protein K1T71_006801 [Dendrolimus kikuchii]|uniref:Uncharacterized protein n=1 Tax=Dendrolimus kikuchii TaxID=765133 RepID=A0ACC1D2V4_9NEOP|nr:hypothetical protein K1T71_006801 [Dendrolimus kikuchii]
MILFRFFWFCVLTSCVVCSVFLLKASLGLYIEDAVTYTVETDYLHWETPFPAVTICEGRDINSSPVDEYLLTNNFSLNQKVFLKEVVFWQKYCKSTCRKCVNCFKEFRDIVLPMRTECEGVLGKCSWDEEPFRCCDRFLPQASEYGLCFTFNSDFYGNGTIATISRKTGLSHLTFTALKTVHIKIHAPADVATVGLQNVLIKCETLSVPMDFETILQVEQTVTDPAVKSISPESRDCVFRNEIPAPMEYWPFSMYSHSACMLYCRAMFQFKHCACIHHLMPDIPGLPFCNLNGLLCISDLQGQISNITCVCPMDCDDLSYISKHESCLKNTKTRETRGVIRFGYLPTLRVRRQPIKDALGFVVDVGGVAGVFFGASLLSIIEIIYLFCMRRER